MSVPDWRDPALSGVKRVALWLHSEVTLGGTFTKQQMRSALSTPHKEQQDEQLDRRMRDLRDEGWAIATYRQDRSLTSRELRFVERGGLVWEVGYRSRKEKAITAKQRQETFAADDYMCRFCGITAGEAYPEDSLRTATLTLSRGLDELVTCCDRCRAGQPSIGSAEDLLSDASRLGEEARAQLLSWLTTGRRHSDPQAQLWARYCRLPSHQRQAFESALRRPP